MNTPSAQRVPRLRSAQRARVLTTLISAISASGREATLAAKYHDPQIAHRIVKRIIWEGQTVEQLIESLWRPVEIDKTALKSKTREVFKHGRTGKNRFSLRITVEDGVVAGWDAKSG